MLVFCSNIDPALAQDQVAEEDDAAEDGDAGDGGVESEDEDEGVDAIELFSQMTSADISFYARTIARLVGVFTHVGDIADAGASWEFDCQAWFARETQQSEGFLVAGGARAKDPRELSNHEARCVSQSQF